MGAASPAGVRPDRLMRRVSVRDAVSFAELHPRVAAGSLLVGEGPPALQRAWDAAGASLSRPGRSPDVVLGHRATAVA